MSKLTVGLTGSAAVTVNETNVARTVGSGSTDVFATPMMIALMERAACEALSGALEDGQTSVGTKIDAEHTAASPVGAEITAAATIESISGRMIEFSIIASDGRGEIGRAKHTRAVVDEAKFMTKAATRI